MVRKLQSFRAYLHLMLTDLENVTLSFFAVNKRDWEENIYNAEDLITAIKRLLPEGDTRNTLMEHAQEWLSATVYVLAKGGHLNRVAIGEENQFFSLFKQNLKQDEVYLNVEHSVEDAWRWNTDLPRMYGTIDTDAWESIVKKLHDTLNKSAIELDDEIDSIDTTLTLYRLMQRFKVEQDEIIIFEGVYEEPDTPDY